MLKLKLISTLNNIYFVSKYQYFGENNYVYITKLLFTKTTNSQMRFERLFGFEM